MKPKIGDLIKLGNWNGIITNVFTSANDTVVEVWWVKNLFQGQGSELLPCGSFSPSSVTEITEEIEHRETRLAQRKTQFLDLLCRRAVLEAARDYWKARRLHEEQMGTDLARTEAHNELLWQMDLAGIEYEDREHAAQMAREWL